MLKQIISYMYKSHDFSVKAIAKALDISEEIVAQYKEKLELIGYIKKEGCSTTKCEKCGCGCSSKSLNPIVKWEFTDKGLALAKRD